MPTAPTYVVDLVRMAANVRITCGRCGFEEDWTPDAFSRHLTETGGSQVWSDVARHLRCRSFGCGSTDVHATAVSRDQRQANMPRRIGRLDAHLLGVALGILDSAARRSRGRAVATLEVRLALLVVHKFANDRDCVRSFWSRASIGNRTADEGLAEPLQVIRHRLVSSGWLAPTFLVDEGKVWPWDSPPPAGWRDADQNSLKPEK